MGIIIRGEDLVREQEREIWEASLSNNRSKEQQALKEFCDKARARNKRWIFVTPKLKNIDK